MGGPIFPHFGHPYVTTSRITFTSVDGRRIVVLDRKGRKRWEKRCTERLRLERLRGDLLYFQCGSALSGFDPETGATWSLGTPPAGRNVFFDSDTGSVYAGSTDFRDDSMLALDPKNLKARWTACGVQRIIHETDSTVIVTRARREYEADSSFTVHDCELMGHSRASGDVLWSIPCGDRICEGGEGVGRWLVIPSDRFSPERGVTAIVDADTGTTRCSMGSSLTDIQETNGVLVGLEHLEPSKDRLVRFDPASCKTWEGPDLVTKEVLQYHLAGPYVITAGWVDLACFDDATGKRLWEKHRQVEWSAPIGTSMILADFDKPTHAARIVLIAITTGGERTLYSEKVTERDESEFRPW